MTDFLIVFEEGNVFKAVAQNETNIFYVKVYNKIIYEFHYGRWLPT